MEHSVQSHCDGNQPLGIRPVERPQDGGDQGGRDENAEDGLTAVAIDERPEDFVADYHRDHEHVVENGYGRVADVELLEHEYAVERSCDAVGERSRQEEDGEGRKTRVAEGLKGMAPSPLAGLVSQIGDGHEADVAEDPDSGGDNEERPESIVGILGREQIEVVACREASHDSGDEIGVGFASDVAGAYVLGNDVGEPAAVDGAVDVAEGEADAEEKPEHEDSGFAEKQRWYDHDAQAKEHFEQSGDEDEPLGVSDSADQGGGDDLRETGDGGDRNEVGDLSFGRAEPEGVARENGRADSDDSALGAPEGAGNDEGVERTPGQSSGQIVRRRFCVAVFPVRFRRLRHLPSASEEGLQLVQ